MEKWYGQSHGKILVKIVGICLAALAGAAAGFAFAVRLGRHRREIESGSYPAASRAAKGPEATPDGTAKPMSE